MSGKRQVVEAIAAMLKEIEMRLLDPSEVSRMAMPDFDALDDALLTAIRLHPEAAIECGLLCPVIKLLSYAPRNGKPKPGTLLALITNLYSSRYGHGFRKLYNGYQLLQPVPIVAAKKLDWTYTGFPIDGYGDWFKTDFDRSKWSLLVHTMIAYFPGLELTRAWSKMFDRDRNMRKQGYKDFVHPLKEHKGMSEVSYVDEYGYVSCGVRNPGGNGLIKVESVNHYVDHMYGNTATLQPGIRAALQLRTVLPDVNKVNKHANHAVGDFLCWGDFTGYQPDYFNGDWDDLIWQGWKHMMNQANQPVGGFQFDKPDLWCLALSQ